MLRSLPKRFLHSAQSRLEHFHPVPNSYPHPAGTARWAERAQVHSYDVTGTECGRFGHHWYPIVFPLETSVQGGCVIRAQS